MTASLGGRYLPALSPPDWSSRPGTAPASTRIVLPSNEAKALFEELGGTFQTLVIGNRVIEGLYVLRTEDASGIADEAAATAIVLIDRRFLWNRAYDARGYNVRARTGELRLIDDGSPPAVQPLAPEVRYRLWSLRGGSPATLRGGLEDVFGELGESATIPPELDQLTDFEDFDDEGTPAQLIDALLAYAPAYQVDLRDDATVVVYRTDDGSERAAIDTGGFHFVEGGGYARVMDRRHERPTYVDVLFGIRAELRFDHDEDLEEIGFEQFDEFLDRPVRRLESVLPIPIRGLDFNGTMLAENSWGLTARFLEALKNFADLPLPPAAELFRGPLSYALLRRYMGRPWELDNLYVHGEDDYTDQRWGQVVYALLDNFRQTYRIAKAWADRFRSIEPTRLAMLDATSRTRGGSPVYGPQTAYPTQRMVYTTNQVRGSYGDFILDPGWAENLANAQKSSGRVRLEDPEAFVLKFRYKKSPFGTQDRILPGLPEDRLLVADDSNAPLAIRGQLIEGFSFQSGYKVATIITVNMGAPNNIGRFYRVRVLPAEAEKVLGRPLGECQGPPATIKVSEGATTTAQFAWSDGFADQIDSALLGVELGSGTVERGAPPPAMPDSLLINREAVEALARAAAARYWAQMADVPIGSVTLLGDKPPPPITGSMKSIQSFIDKDGVVNHRVSFAGEVAAPDLASLLPPAIRRTVLGLV